MEKKVLTLTVSKRWFEMIADEIASDCILKVLDKAKKEATQDV